MTSSQSPLAFPPKYLTPVDKPLDTMTVDELAEAVRYHNWRYFELARPEISDYAFDALTRRLKALAPDHPVLSELVPAKADERLVHDQPMLSLDKAYDAATVQRWAKSFAGELIEAPKIDGVAASLKYDERGRLTHAVTRGDGVRGELFTRNAHYISAIPKEVAATGTPFEIRGEVYLPIAVFKSRFAGEFANPRNTCAGAIKQKEASKTADYGLAFLAYGVRGRAEPTLSAGLDWAGSMGFPVVPFERRARDAIEAGYETWLARRAELDFEVDGVVYSADSVAEQQRLGETAHHPRWAIAYKFQGDSGASRIVDIEWSVSRSGVITPIAVIEPVTLSGASVTRCSLHNLAILNALGASVGARVIAMRRGGVIPHIETVLEPGPEPAQVPARCPVSGHATEVHGDFLTCSEPHHCPAARLGTLEHWLKAVGIDGFGPKILSQLFERGWLTAPRDVYRLRLEDLASLDRLGRKSAEKLLEAVEGHRRIPLATFLMALGVADLGASAAQKVAETFGSLARVMAASELEIAAIYGLGKATATSIRRGLDVRLDIVRDLLEEVVVGDHAVAPSAPANDLAAANDPIRGRGFVFTGKLATLTRAEAQAAVLAQGGRVVDDVSKKLDYLVIGDEPSALTGGGEPSAKQKKAEKLVAEGAPLRLMSEAAFRALMGLG